MRNRLAAFCSFLIIPVASFGSDPIEIARQLDQLLITSFQSSGVSVAPRVNDEDFLRRASLDITGMLPTPADVTRFGLDPNPSKRAARIDLLLASPDYGKVWASYWTDVIFLRATEQRARQAQPAFMKWMEEQLNADRPWNEITREMLTATGSVSEVGSTALIYAHTGDPAELAAEIARIFQGIQMSCANCHDHPTDSWKREQFHQLAAFLPRISVRPEEPGNMRSFAVSSFQDNGRGPRGGEFDPEQLFRMADLNRDGLVSKSELRGPLAERFDEMLSRADDDKDGKLSKAEFANLRPPANAQPGRGSSEYYMPDLNNPASRGTMMQPAFFIKESKGPRLSPGADDLTRREALADYITAPSNPWFSRAIVNRIWGELLGRGFYSPIDDIGPERQAIHEDVLELLSREFVANGYSLKWLYRTIMNTDAYQRQLAPAASAEPVPFASATPGRLRADQIYNSLISVLGAPQGQPMQFSRETAVLRAAGLDAQKFAFSQLFGFDPSTPQDDVLGTVPQALFLMNSAVIESQVRAAGSSRLSRILTRYPQDEIALEEIYLMTLSRSPTSTELAVNLDYITQVGSRGEAYEDILWSLLNSTEFCSRR